MILKNGLFPHPIRSKYCIAKKLVEYLAHSTCAKLGGLCRTGDSLFSLSTCSTFGSLWIGLETPCSSYKSVDLDWKSILEKVGRILTEESKRTVGREFWQKNLTKGRLNFTISSKHLHTLPDSPCSRLGNCLHWNPGSPVQTQGGHRGDLHLSRAGIYRTESRSEPSSHTSQSGSPGHCLSGSQLGCSSRNCLQWHQHCVTVHCVFISDCLGTVNLSSCIWNLVHPNSSLYKSSADFFWSQSGIRKFWFNRVRYNKELTAMQNFQIHETKADESKNNIPGSRRMALSHCLNRWSRLFSSRFCFCLARWRSLISSKNFLVRKAHNTNVILKGKWSKICLNEHFTPQIHSLENHPHVTISRVRTEISTAEKLLLKVKLMDLKNAKISILTGKFSECVFGQNSTVESNLGQCDFGWERQMRKVAKSFAQFWAHRQRFQLKDLALKLQHTFYLLLKMFFSELEFDYALVSAGLNLKLAEATS